jgi:hypothetical protein
MTPKKLVEQPTPREYMRVEEINRQQLGVLQFKFGLKVYSDSKGSLVVEKGEYNAAIRQQENR